MAKQFWRIISNPNLLASQCIIQRYRKDNVDQLLSSTSPTSKRWIDISRAAQLLLPNMRWHCNERKEALEVSIGGNQRDLYLEVQRMWLI